MKKAYSVLCFLLDWALVCVGVLGSLLCLLTAFSLPDPPGLWFLVPGMALLFCLVFRGKPGRWYALGVLVLLVLAALLLRGELAEGFRNLWGELGRRYALGYDQVIDFLPRDPTSPEGVLPALAALAVLETYLCSLAVRLWRRTFPAVLALLPGILPCFILTDTPPALLPLLAAVFSLLTQAFSQSVRRRGTGEQGKAVALAALLSAALLGLLLLIFPQERYTPPLSWEELTQEMRQWGQTQSNRGNIRAGLSGNPEEITLAELGALPNHPVAVLRARSTRNDYLYLRGCGYTNFDGRSWTRDTEHNWDSSVLFPCLGQSREATLTIETVKPEDALYTTYQLTSLPAGGVQVSDAYLSNPEELTQYTMQYTSSAIQPPSNGLYERWVSDSCLYLPGQTRSGVLAWWEAQGESTDLRDYLLYGGETAMSAQENLARKAAARISRCAAYSRNPAQAPRDVDFCTWFLNDAEEGYCVHYATACTALLRALGVPARYVSGYVCSAVANKTVTVTNLQAHAWVEIWVRGCWIVVEPTPDDATEFNGWGQGSGNDPVVHTEPSTEATRSNGSEDPEITRPSRPVPSTEAPRPSKDPEDASGSEGSGGKGMDPQSLKALWIAFAVIGVPLLALGRRRLALRLWERRLQGAKGNEKARLLYRRMLRLQKLGGGAIPAEARELAYKAVFSQHELTDNELLCLRQVYAQQRNRLDRGGLWKRFLCKYILAVI